MTENDKNILKLIVENFTFKGSDISYVLEIFDNLENDELTTQNKEALKNIIHNTSFKGSDIKNIGEILKSL